MEALDLHKMAPGTWGCLHMLALLADEDPEDGFLPLLYFIKSLCKRFKMEECRQHFSNFVRTERIYPGQAFEWTVKAHNIVNKRTNKKVLTPDEAREIWGADNIKLTPCSSEPESTPTTPQASLFLPPPVSPPLPTTSSKNSQVGGGKSSQVGGAQPNTAMGPLMLMNAVGGVKWSPQCGLR